MSTGQGIWDVQPSSLFFCEDEGPTRPLRRLRGFARLTLSELADELGVAPTDVALWERGAPIPERVVERAAHLFNVKPAYIRMCGDEAARQSREMLERLRANREDED